MKRAALVAVLATAALVPSAAGAEPQGRIVGGTQAAPGAYPAQVAVDTTGVGACGGTLVARRKVVTAAHCIDVGLLGPAAAAPSQVTVRAGSARRSQGTAVAVTRVAMHAGYDRRSGALDVAVLTLAGDAPPAAVPAPLADPAVDAGDYEPGDPARVAGWGRTSEGGPSVDDLREVELPIVSDAECNDADSYDGELVADVMLCAGLAAGGKDSCQGDSGGPLYVPADGVIKLVGVVSFGDGCARPQKYGVYTELPAGVLRDFVLGETGSPPTVAIADPGPLTAGRAVALTATTTDAQAVAWDLDADGAFDDATGGTASYTPPAAGTFAVRARAVDADGMVAVTERTVTASAPASGSSGSAGTGGGGGGGGGDGGGGAGPPASPSPAADPGTAPAADPAPAAPPPAGPAPAAARATARAPARLVVSARGRRALRVRGTVRAPGCAGGLVRVSSYRGVRLLGRRTATLGPACTFVASVPARGRVTVKVRFLGTATALPASATLVRRVPAST